MRPLARKFFLLLAKESRFLAVVWLVLTAALFAACALKYAQFRYTGIDLAYFNQVLWNTVHGMPFLQTIHPHLSLGDHAEFILLLLAAPYSLLKHPLTLLALQAAAVTAPAFLVFEIATERYRAIKPPFGAAPLFLAVAWLLNASVHGIALFEFHALAFALVPLLFAALAYERGKFVPFLLWSLVAILVREDVALVVAAFGLLAWLEKRPLAWRVTPIVLGATYFIGAMTLIAHFAPAGSYKFAVYYGWLRENPLALPAHLFSLGNLEMVLALLMPVAFLPFLAPRRLVLLLGPLAQIVLGAPGGGAIVAETHYATLFLPAIFLAAIDGLAAAPEAAKKLERRFGGEEWRLVPALAVVVCAFYSLLVLGPLPRAVPALFDRVAWRRAAAARDALRVVGPSDAVTSSFSTLPHLSSRSSLYSAHYIFLGVTQFAERPYPPPTDLRLTVLDVEELAVYAAQMPATTWSAPYYADGRARLTTAIGPETYVSGPFSVHDRDARPFIEALRKPLAGHDGVAWKDDGIVLFARATTSREPTSGVAHMHVDATFSALANADRHMVELVLLDAAERTLAVEKRPLVGLVPVPVEGGRVAFAADLRLDDPSKIAALRVRILDEPSAHALDALKTPHRVPLSSEQIDVLDVTF